LQLHQLHCWTKSFDVGGPSEHDNVGYMLPHPVLMR
jgi:hypothetical protein